jgi:hypothetical protein
MSQYSGGHQVNQASRVGYIPMPGTKYKSEYIPLVTPALVWIHGVLDWLFWDWFPFLFISAETSTWPVWSFCTTCPHWTCKHFPLWFSGPYRHIVFCLCICSMCLDGSVVNVMLCDFDDVKLLSGVQILMETFYFFAFHLSQFTLNRCKNSLLKFLFLKLCMV